MRLTGEPFNYCAILDDYEMGKLLGKGGFGVVYLATNKLSNKQYAIKFMDMTQARKYSISISCLSSLRVVSNVLQSWFTISK